MSETTPQEPTTDLFGEATNQSTRTLAQGAINTLAVEVHNNAVAKGLYDNNAPTSEFIAAACSNLHGEVSELWEAYRKGELNNPCDKSLDFMVIDETPLTCVEEELADIIIRALDVSQHLGIDIGMAVTTKHKLNTTREYRHGGKLA